MLVCPIGPCILRNGKVDQSKIDTILQLFFQEHTVVRISLPYPILLGPSFCNCPLCFWFLGITIDPVLSLMIQCKLLKPLKTCPTP
ncbi:hypothetical protein FJTKL_02011 [Diaporthe vaccinii]|uniref:Uncharacterized protein n=1 Tax=Diaporthe vaccinii TaxID=105482 RepID=A0ABR4DZB6_9PEZI